jgi:Protein of unknown function (DUF455)
MAERMKRGFEVDDNAVRFSNYFHVLRELVHLHSGWLPLEPSFEQKYLLGDHLHDDARAVSKVRRRLYELRHPSDFPARPGEELEALLARMNDASSTDDYFAIAYGEVKPALLEAIGFHLAKLDPVSDEPSMRLLRQLEARQKSHLTRAGRLRRNLAHGDLGALPLRLHESRDLRVMARIDQPARDPFVEVTGDGDPYLKAELYLDGAENHVPTEAEEQKHFFHGLMDAELCAAELMARNSHEHPDMPWDFHCDMARQVWDELRHAKMHDILMRDELGCQWGDYPVGFSHFKSIYRLELLARLALFNGTRQQRAVWQHSQRRSVLVEQGQEMVAQVFDYLLADEGPHVDNGTRWGTYLMDGDERAYRQKVHELRAGADRAGQAVES